MPLLSVKQLNVSFGQNKVVQDLSFDLNKNEILGIVGESGSGKSVSSLAIMRLLSPKAKIEGDILFQEQNISKLSEEEVRRLRGNDISMIFQEPMSSLNPSMKCGKQVCEILQLHKKLSFKDAKNEVLQLFEKVKLPRPQEIFKSYPHQISGGQKQRVMIAMAIACKPKLLIADEPTTALDVTVQKEILQLLKDIQRETKMSIIFISHDLALVAQFANRVAVMYQGKLVEINTSKEIFTNPQQAYSKALLASKPRTDQRLKKLPTVTDILENNPPTEIETKIERQQRHQELYAKEPLLKVNQVSKIFGSKGNWFKKDNQFYAVNDVSFELYEGETLGLVGESGCGKSTLGNLILGIEKVNAGEIWYKGQDLANLSSKEFKKLRREIQLIFQDPFSSLNPRLSVGEAIVEPMLVHHIYANRKEAVKKAYELLDRVGLSAEHFHRYPHEFSGGQRQRIGIARTIGVQPKLVICDESVSALDISVQAQVLNLLNELKQDFGFTYIFISHDLSVVKYMSDQLLVMYQGEIVERGDADDVYANPKKEYTSDLIAAIPQ
ncbi:peptide/nickel transport system ATP-binding protein [Psychroflexus halocasei]|uniref:Peptide/nickel transport system ATP-binding protein n=2 Tax=Psychroflexus halocasei TaxID=908615 RepID=A0A1H4DIX3_9FLAO|nr:peptide/nickel transport system ATP-binding protein [Psychroflexus halocasei]